MTTSINFNARLAILLASFVATLTTAFAQGTAFTYQGRLDSGANPDSGIYDLRFAIYELGSGGSAVAGPLTNGATPVSEGRFTVTLDFGAGVFDGAQRWLEIGVRTNAGGAFATLSPRQPVTPTPYAIHAFKAGAAVSAATVGADGVGTASLQNNAVTSAKISDNSVTAADVNAASFSNTFWKVDGNAGTLPGTHFLGTTDNQPVELKANGARALRLEPAGGNPNLIGGHASNTITAGTIGSVIAGGGSASFPHRMEAEFSGIVGGTGHHIETGADQSQIGGGFNHRIASGARLSTVGGGQSNAILTNSWGSTIGGGSLNTASGNSATVAGGFNNTANGAGATVGGGYDNAAGNLTTAFATVSGGQGNTANASYSTVGGGSGNTASGNFATVAGGQLNSASHNNATVGGGYTNTASGLYATVAGGQFNVASAPQASIGGGYQNVANGFFATIPGGFANAATSYYAFAAGRRAKANHEGAFVWADSTDADFASTRDNQFLIRATGGVGIGTPNPGAMLQVGDVNTPNSQGMIRLASRSGTGAGNRYWDIGVPENNENFAGKSYSFVIDDPQLGVEPEVVVRWDTGNMGIGVTNPASKLHVNGTVTATAFNPPSDRNLKENFALVDPQAVLEKVAALPISRWNFIGDDASPHVGPMAQDFHAAFGLGSDDRHIATVDADGVALAAIQGLNQKVDAANAALRAENVALRQELNRIKELLNQLTNADN